MVGAAFKQVASDFSGLDILINNAGATQKVRVADMRLTDWERLMRINATGTFLCSREALKYMNGWGGL